MIQQCTISIICVSNLKSRKNGVMWLKTLSLTCVSPRCLSPHEQNISVSSHFFKTKTNSKHKGTDQDRILILRHHVSVLQVSHESWPSCFFGSLQSDSFWTVTYPPILSAFNMPYLLELNSYGVFAFTLFDGDVKIVKIYKANWLTFYCLWVYEHVWTYISYKLNKPTK